MIQNLPPLRKQGRVYAGLPPHPQSPTNYGTLSSRNGSSYGTLTPRNGGTASNYFQYADAKNGGIHGNGGVHGSGAVMSFNGGTLVNGGSGGTLLRLDSEEQPISSGRESNGSKTSSILKKTDIGHRRRYSSTPSLQQAFNQLNENSSTYRSPQTSRRRVNFKNKVSIFRFGGSDGDSVCSSSECEPLKDSPSSKSDVLPTLLSPPYSSASIYIDDDDEVQPDGLVARLANRSPPLTRRLPRRQTASPMFLPQDPNAGPVVLHSNDGSVIISGSSDGGRPSSARIGNVEFNRTADNRLQLIIRLDTRSRDVALRPNDLLVKANKTGDRLRVVASSEAEERRVGALRINELVKLPSRVDSYRLTARLDPSGHLVVHAPLL